MQRSAVSITSNIAEGYERNSDKEFVRFLYISKGSLSELITQIEIARDVGLISIGKADLLEKRYNKIVAMLTKLIQAKKGT